MDLVGARGTDDIVDAANPAASHGEDVDRHSSSHGELEHDARPVNVPMRERVRIVDDVADRKLGGRHDLELQAPGRAVAHVIAGSDRDRVIPEPQ